MVTWGESMIMLENKMSSIVPLEFESSAAEDWRNLR